MEENILITGINGFVGKHLSRGLKDHLNVCPLGMQRDSGGQRAFDILDLERLKRVQT
ncbi:MAG: hypothetical protein WA941_14540 [Nitrososphaeraceae archaeon]